MQLTITRIEGLRNDLLLRLQRSEIESALLSVASRGALMALPGMPRHRPATPDESGGMSAAKITIEEHLQRLGVLDPEGGVHRRAVAISNRNLGTNHGHVAWQRGETPRAFRIREDPQVNAPRSCLVAREGGALSIEDLRFDFEADRLTAAAGGPDPGDTVEWAVYGQPVLRRGRVASMEDLVDQFYDVRHLFGFEAHRPEGAAVRDAIYAGYPASFAANVRGAWRAGVPRARYFHNAIGLSADEVLVLQREGTVEEVGAALRECGAEDGLILDNGGSIACWAWWVNTYSGGLLSPTVDYRPEGTSAIAFILRGPLTVHPPGGSVSPTVL